MAVGDTNFGSKFGINEIQKKIYHPSRTILAVSWYHVTIRGPDTFFCKKYLQVMGILQASCLCDTAFSDGVSGTIIAAASNLLE
jgi:hypothetical protein